jgi:hypothetical protein
MRRLHLGCGGKTRSKLGSKGCWIFASHIASRASSVTTEQTSYSMLSTLAEKVSCSSYISLAAFSGLKSDRQQYSLPPSSRLTTAFLTTTAPFLTSSKPGTIRDYHNTSPYATPTPRWPSDLSPTISTSLGYTLGKNWTCPLRGPV